jgi:anaerobic dimethyl sulfoxide reductase subunit C (anchor subunit)
MGEIPLILFTLCMQAAIGIIIFNTLGKQIYKDKTFKKASLIAAILSIIGLFASLIHLGVPFHALNSLLHLGSSWLSREVLFSGIFGGIAVVFAFVQYRKADNEAFNRILRWVGSIVGLFDIFFMAKVYSTTSVPAWHGVNTFIDFYATAIAVGGLVFLAASLSELTKEDKKIFAFIVFAAAILQGVVTVPYSISLGLNGMAALESASILNNMSGVIVLKWLLIMGGAAILLVTATQQAGTKEAKFASSMIYVACIALIVGEIISRYAFYAAMVVTKVGLT